MQVILETSLLFRAFELWEAERRAGNCTDFDDSVSIEDFGYGQVQTLLDFYGQAEAE